MNYDFDLVEKVLLHYGFMFIDVLCYIRNYIKLAVLLVTFLIFKDTFSEQELQAKAQVFTIQELDTERKTFLQLLLKIG